MATTMSELPHTAIDEVLNRLQQSNQPFAFLYRPLSDRQERLLMLEGEVTLLDSLSQLSLDNTTAQQADLQGTQVSQLVLVPFNQLRERGYACINDDEPIVVMRASQQRYWQVGQVLDAIRDLDLQVLNNHFDLDDGRYGDIVSAIINDEISAGEGSNFVISRSLEGDISEFTPAHALTLFKRLLKAEHGAYWTWMVYTGDRYFIGSTPEQHIQVKGNRVAMNPISGTLRYPTAQDVLEKALYGFLQDEKERNELFMVVDEELKMMSGFCHSGIKVTGPQLKMMSRIAHTEYFIEGKSQLPLAEILKHSLFAPTVTGSPIENACKVIARRETRGRGYYSGVVALTGTDDSKRYLDSAILIRTADIAANGHFRLTAGATIVRDSLPQNEAEETRAKLSGLMDSFFAPPANATYAGRPQLSPEVASNVEQLLAQRNQLVSAFWLGKSVVKSGMIPAPTITLIDMEDSFTEMIAYQLRSTGYQVTIVPWYQAKIALPELKREGAEELLFIGPGPGDPTSTKEEKMLVARELITNRLQEQRPLTGTCLGHQLICVELGLPISRLPKTRQGTQYCISLQGHPYYVAFYNSFAAMYDQPLWYSGIWNRQVLLDRLDTNEVVALQGEGISSIQFHNESFLTQDAFAIYQWLITSALKSARQQVDVV